MNKMLRKFLSLSLSLMILSVSIIYAEADSQHIRFMPGDVNGDFFVNSQDAREVLRAAAKLYELPQSQFPCADLNRDGIISSVDARVLLRAAARLEPIKYTATLAVGDNFYIDWLYPGTVGNVYGHQYWSYDTQNTDVIKVSATESTVSKEKYDMIAQSDAGSAVEQTFTVTVEKQGIAELHFYYHYGIVGYACEVVYHINVE